VSGLEVKVLAARLMMQIMKSSNSHSKFLSFHLSMISWHIVYMSNGLPLQQGNPMITIGRDINETNKSLGFHYMLATEVDLSGIWDQREAKRHIREAHRFKSWF
jgi:hypothetical protein